MVVTVHESECVTLIQRRNVSHFKTGLEEDVTKLKVHRVNLEATLQEERAKTNLLLREIKESNEVKTVHQPLSLKGGGVQSVM